MIELRKRLLGHQKCSLVVPDNLHITLFFLGATTEEQCTCYEKIAKQVVAYPFELRLEEVCHRRRQQVVWIGAGEMPEELTKLIETMNDRLEPCDYHAERRKFLPHVTLARKVMHKISESEVDPIIWPVHDFHLVESFTHQTGAEYQIIKTWPLQGEGDLATDAGS